MVKGKKKEIASIEAMKDFSPLGYQTNVHVYKLPDLIKWFVVRIESSSSCSSSSSSNNNYSRYWFSIFFLVLFLLICLILHRI